MKKYTFAVHHASYHAFLDDLQEMGIVHVGKSTDKKLNTEAAKLAEEAQNIQKTIEILKPFQNDDLQVNETNISSGEIVLKAEKLKKQFDAERVALDQVKSKMDVVSVWGNYSAKLISDLKESGINVRFYSIAAKRFNPEWLDKYAAEIVNESGNKIRFVVCGNESFALEGAYEDKMPQDDFSSLSEEKEIRQKNIEKTETELKTLAENSIGKLRNQLANMETRLDWLDVRFNQSVNVGEGVVYLLEGWVPVSAEKELQEYLENNKLFYLNSPAEKGERPPIKLKNNKFGKLFEPISKLFALPDYQELDLTIYFAPFFMLFFGFCLGDAGYGLVLLIGTTIYKRFASAQVKGYLTLGQLFGASTLLMGLIFGTFFGVELSKVSTLGNLQGMFLSSTQIFSLSLVVGGIQIVFGIVLRIVNQLRQEYPLTALGSAGWLLIFITAGLFEFLLKSTELSSLLSIVRIAMYSISLFMIVFFSVSGPVHMRLIGGIWEIYNTVTSIFGDLLSYIRLFALGIASSILGLVINQMAVSFGSAKFIGPVIFILIIVIGHTANIAISSLGAFVHPMRLTFVEFYKNAGFKGSGKPYNPFTKNKNLSTI